MRADGVCRRAVTWVRINGTTNMRAKLAMTSSDPEVLRRLACDPLHPVRLEVAANPSTPVSLLNELAQADDLSVEKHIMSSITLRVIWNPNTSSETLERLANKGLPILFPFIAKHANVLTMTLRQLFSADAKQYVLALHQVLADNPKTPAEILDQLANSESFHVRMRVAGNRSTQAGTLARLKNDPNPYVQRALKDNPFIPLR